MRIHQDVYFTPIEAKRLCGYRTVGSLYLMAAPNSTTCHRLPLPLNVPCDTCGEILRFNRSISYISPLKLFQICPSCIKQPYDRILCEASCTACNPPLRGFLIWVGRLHYTPKSFLHEANTLGICKKIPFIPKHFDADRPWYFAHGNAMHQTNLEAPPQSRRAGVFLCGYFQRFEKLIWQKDATPDAISLLNKQNITPIVVPDGNPHHSPKKQKEIS